MADGPKTGRRASAEERECARKWVERYRRAEQSPDGRYCVNPEAPHEEQYFICADDPEPLLQALSSFAEHGTLQAIDFRDNGRRLVIRAELEQLRQAGVAYDDRIATVAEKYRRSTREIQRWATVPVNDKK